MPLFIHTYYLADTHSSPSEWRKISFLWPLLQMFVFQQWWGTNPAAGEASGEPETIPTSSPAAPGRCLVLSRGSGGTVPRVPPRAGCPLGPAPTAGGAAQEAAPCAPQSLLLSCGVSPTPLLLPTLCCQKEGHKFSPGSTSAASQHTAGGCRLRRGHPDIGEGSLPLTTPQRLRRSFMAVLPTPLSPFCTARPGKRRSDTRGDGASSLRGAQGTCCHPGPGTSSSHKGSTKPGAIGKTGKAHRTALSKHSKTSRA